MFGIILNTYLSSFVMIQISGEYCEADTKHTIMNTCTVSILEKAKCPLSTKLFTFEKVCRTLTLFHISYIILYYFVGHHMVKLIY